MLYPNLAWAIDHKRLAHYELALNVGMERTRLSRCLNGAAEFALREKERIATALDFPMEWLFAEPRPPRMTPRPFEQDAPTPARAGAERLSDR